MITEDINTSDYSFDPSLPKIKFDPEDYRDEIDEMDLSEEQAIEYLQTLWDIMYTMVNLGWGVESVQNILPSEFEKASSDSGKLLQVEGSSNFNANVEIEQD